VAKSLTAFADKQALGTENVVTRSGRASHVPSVGTDARLRGDTATGRSTTQNIKTSNHADCF
jgi:hypothetical protein